MHYSEWRPTFQEALYLSLLKRMETEERKVSFFNGVTGWVLHAELGGWMLPGLIGWIGSMDGANTFLPSSVYNYVYNAT